jgi:hypothetical protein
MNDIQRVRSESIGRCVQWFLDRIADILVASILHTKFTALQAAHANILDLAAQLAAGQGSTNLSYSDKGGDRETLRGMMAAISRMATAMAADFPGVDILFEFRRNLNDQDLLAKARAFATQAVAHEANFIAYGLDSTFIADLTAAADAFEASIDTTNSAVEGRVSLGAQLDDAISLASQLKRSVSTMVETQFTADIGAIAAWASASHVEALLHAATPATP